MPAQRRLTFCYLATTLLLKVAEIAEFDCYSLDYLISCVMYCYGYRLIITPNCAAAGYYNDNPNWLNGGLKREDRQDGDLHS